MEIKVFATLRQVVGRAAVEVPAGPGDTVRTALEQLVALYPLLESKVWDGQGGLSGSVNVFVNGRNVLWVGGLDLPLTEGDTLAIFPPVAGG